MNDGRKISVTGLGYVGLPVAVAFGLQGRPVIAFDINEARIAELKAGTDSTGEISSEKLKGSLLTLTRDPEDLKKADFHIITVPTPIDHINRPDLSPLIAASRAVGAQLKKGDIVVYESTVYPGITEDECLPVLEAVSGLIGGTDFTIGYSPERINPGDTVHTFENIIKVVSGQNPATLDIIATVYESVVTAGVHRAASIKTAEAAKVIENSQRDLNIAFMNELSIIFHKLDIDTGDVLEAAGTKWNFLPFTPGLVGGHCIGVDPFYLTHKAEQAGYTSQVILAGRRINDKMSHCISEATLKYLLTTSIQRPFRVTVLGITFKEDVPDYRNTKVVNVIRELEEYGIEVQVHDPQANPADVEKEYGITLSNAEDLKPAHAVVLAVAHASYRQQGWELIKKSLIDGTGFVADVRGFLDRSTKPEGITLWRL